MSELTRIGADASKAVFTLHGVDAVDCGTAGAGTPCPVEFLLAERAISVDTAAAAGNASLMTIG